MRLRYLHVQDLPPLQDVSLVFGRDPVLQRPCSINFVVGVNGTGKTTMLLALAQTLLALEQQTTPHFPITLAFDLNREGGRTILLQHSGGARENAALVEFDVLPDSVLWPDLERINWLAGEPASPYPFRQRLKVSDLGTIGSGSIGRYLPSLLLAFTSGSPDPWEQVFSSSGPAAEPEELFDSLPTSDDPSSYERPVGWNSELESEYRMRQPDGGEILAGGETAGSRPLPYSTAPSIGLFVSLDELKYAVLSVALSLAEQVPPEAPLPGDASESTESLRTGFQKVANEVGWRYPVTLRLTIDFQPERYDRVQSNQLIALYNVATHVLREPEPRPYRHLYFDLGRPVLDTKSQETRSTLDALTTVLAGESAAPISLFKQFISWRDDKVLLDATIALRTAVADDLLTYERLSDGERAFLGRMALFHLLGWDNPALADDALIVLDEPETHFNDYWKRQIVDIIDNSLRDTHADVVISTHSSIALTDAFAEEIQLLVRDPETGNAMPQEIPIPTFGADPGEIMLKVFGAPRRIGDRAQEYLQRWLGHDWREGQEEVLEEIIRKIGPGYYRSELRSVLRNLHNSAGGNADAPQS